MRVLFIGSNPSSASPDDSAFHPSSGTRKKLDSWLHGVAIECAFVNVADYKTPSNRALSSKEIIGCLPGLRSKIAAYPGYKIVAVGSTANKALKMLDVDGYHAMPHPSGRSRKLNDPLFVASSINALISFIKGYNIYTDV